MLSIDRYDALGININKLPNRIAWGTGIRYYNSTRNISIKGVLNILILCSMTEMCLENQCWHFRSFSWIVVTILLIWINIKFLSVHNLWRVILSVIPNNLFMFHWIHYITYNFWTSQKTRVFYLFFIFMIFSHLYIQKLE